MRTPQIERRELARQTAAVVRSTVTTAGIEQFVGRAFGTVARLLASRGMSPAGPPFSRYHPVGGQEFEIETGFPTSAAVLPSGEVVVSSLPGGTAAVLTYVGPYDQIAAAYDALSDWVAREGGEPTPPWPRRTCPSSGSPARAANRRVTRGRSISPIPQRNPTRSGGAPRSSSRSGRDGSRGCPFHHRVDGHFHVLEDLREMSGIWAQDTAGLWRPLAATGFVAEADLHDLIEANPAMLPLAGSPRIAVIGREVRCGLGFADLVAVELDTGRPVVIEVKLAANSDRRQALTQVLGYAAYLRRVDLPGLDALVQGYLGRHGFAAISAALTAAAADDPGYAAEELEGRLVDALATGRLRAVIVLDAAPPDLVELVGYLQEVSNDRLSVDLVTVSAYDVGGRRVLVPQLVEPDESQVTAATAGTGRPVSRTEVVPGSTEFDAGIDHAPRESREQLRSLLAWAREMEKDRLLELSTSIGKGRWVLTMHLPGQSRGMFVLWNENGPYVSPFRSVLEQVAPSALAELEQRYPAGIGQGNYLPQPYDDALLQLIRRAYEEAADGQRRLAEHTDTPR